ncbi:MAG: pyrroline-5-carboxylate reductase [Nitrospirae bacterium]|nr:pyrroline-5-carboxylate reductase [Nitrospirota bacterium]MCL5237221.1 pyrroline-5-carboxylate reductase [Nitrospirota bacterium]
MIGFIGGGNMAEALIKGMTAQGMKDILVSEPREDRRAYLQQTYGIKATQSNKEVVSRCAIIILAVKPQIMAPILDEMADAVTGEKTVVSIAAGITLSYLASKLNTKKLIRVMPNTPALVQEGMSVMSLCECFSDKDIATVREIFISIGKVLTLPEKYMNAVTALSGSGPAFIALFTEAMTEAGVKMGLRRDSAAELAVQTLLGTARLLDTGMAPEKLREMVTSPGGTTAAGLKVLEERDLKGIVADTLNAAVKRAEELGIKN